MKPSLRTFSAVALSFAFLGCGKEKTKAPDPKPVGHWKWSNQTLGTWRMDISADGKFQREIINPLEPKPSTISGAWTLQILDSETKGGPDDALMRSAGYDPSKESTEWSALGTLTLSYSVPQGARLEPGAMVLETKPGPGARGGETPIQERHTVRTRTDKSSGAITLYLGGKTFQKFEGAGASAVPVKEAGIASAEKRVPGSQAAALVGAPRWLKVEPVTGISFELPDNWKALEPGASEKILTSLDAIAAKPREMKTNTTWIFVPPGNVPDVNITLSIQPAIMTPQEMAAASQEVIDRFAVGFANTASTTLSAKGYQLKPGPRAERVNVGRHPALSCVGEAVNWEGGKLIMQSMAIGTERATVVLGFIWADAPGATWEAVMKHASNSLQLTESIAAPAQ